MTYGAVSIGNWDSNGMTVYETYRGCVSDSKRKNSRVNVPQRERERTKNSTTEPLDTPTMAGGLFSIDREFFYEMGAYDEGMIIWGSENLEMAFRVSQ